MAVAHPVNDPAVTAPADVTDLTVRQRFDPASPALVESRALQQRVDRKYLIAAADLTAVLAGLAPGHCLLLAGERAWARYQSLYFDTPDLWFFHAHRCGRRPRYKVRIRHHLDRALSFLEVKQKERSGRTAKHRLPLPAGQNDLGPRERQFIDGHAPLAGRRLVPRLTMSFERLTLVGRDADERVTLDRELTVVAGAAVAALGAVVIAEVKQARHRNHSGAIDVLRRVHAPEVALSKYCVATVLVAPVPANVFKPALRAVARLAV